MAEPVAPEPQTIEQAILWNLRAIRALLEARLPEPPKAPPAAVTAVKKTTRK